MRMIVLCLLMALNVAAQNSYPQGYFRNPLNIPILLAGNFGECRPGHFHSGIDIKTGGKENVVVYAAADGYVSRVKMEPGGFGHGLYITHPNGYTTLYAHLNDFFPELQQEVRAAQYKKKSWELDLNFVPEQFPVKKGMAIAWSGNTGGSSAPHLHFEIRDTKTEHPLNPMLFGFDLKDGIPPVVSHLALYQASESIYEQDPQRVRVIKKGGNYTTERDTVLTAAQEVFLGMAVHDFMDQSNNTLAFYTAEWYADDSLQGRLVLDDIGYDETRYLNACADYKLQKETGIWFNSLFLLPNNKLGRIYSELAGGNGALQLKSGASTRIKIVLKDANGNQSMVQFVLRQRGSSTTEKKCASVWYAGEKKKHETPGIRFSLGQEAFYDNICYRQSNTYVNRAISPLWTVYKPSVPLHKYFELGIKPDRAVPFLLNSKVVLMYTDGKSSSGRAALLGEGWFTAPVRNFGAYWLAVDTIAPVITPLVKSGLPLGNRKEVRFSVKDNMTSVKQFEGKVNGQWLCFEQHGNSWFYIIDGYCPKGKVRLELKATDENGNERRLEYYFTR